MAYTWNFQQNPFSNTLPASQRMYNQYLNQMFNIWKGRTSPWETPQFRGMSQYMEKLGDQEMQRMYRDAIGRGVTGGSLEQLMQQMQEGVAKQKGGAIENMYQQAGQQGTGMAQTGLQMGSQWGQNADQMRLALQQFEAQKRAQESATQWQRFMQMIQMGGNLGLGIMSGGLGGMGGVGAGENANAGYFGNPTYQNYVQGKQWY